MLYVAPLVYKRKGEHGDAKFFGLSLPPAPFRRNTWKKKKKRKTETDRKRLGQLTDGKRKEGKKAP